MPSIGWRDLRAKALAVADIGIAGTVSAVIAANVIEASDRYEGAQFWTGGWLLVETPTSDQTARIASWDADNKRFNLDRGLTGVGPGQRYLVWRSLQPDSLMSTLRSALREAWRFFTPPVRWEQVLQGDLFRYPITPTIAPRAIYRVELEPWDALDTAPWAVIVDWRYFGDGSAIELPKEFVWTYNGRRIRIWGAPPLPDLTPTATLVLEEEGDEDLLAQYLAGSLLVSLGQQWAAQRIVDGQQAQATWQMGQVMRRQAIEPVRTRHRDVVRRQLLPW